MMKYLAVHCKRSYLFCWKNLGSKITVIITKANSLENLTKKLLHFWGGLCDMPLLGKDIHELEG